MKSETGVKDFSRTPPPASLVPLVLSGPLCPAGISPPRGESPLSGEAYLPTPCEIKSPTCIRKRLNINITDTGKGNNRCWQAPGGQRGQRANSAGRFRHGCTRKLLSSGKSAGRCGHRPLHIPRDSSIKSNISRKGKGNHRRWQAPGGQRGTSEFRRTVLT